MNPDHAHVLRRMSTGTIVPVTKGDVKRRGWGTRPPLNSLDPDVKRPISVAVFDSDCTDCGNDQCDYYQNGECLNKRNRSSVEVLCIFGGNRRRDG